MYSKHLLNGKGTPEKSFFFPVYNFSYTRFQSHLKIRPFPLLGKYLVQIKCAMNAS